MNTPSIPMMISAARPSSANSRLMPRPLIPHDSSRGAALYTAAFSIRTLRPTSVVGLVPADRETEDADIFAANCTNNGIAAIAVAVEQLIDRCQLTVDLERYEVRDGDFVVRFEIDAFRRERLLQGYDEIAMTLRHQDAIARYELSRS